MPKRKCSCGCCQMVSEETDRVHRQALPPTLPDIPMLGLQNQRKQPTSPTNLSRPSKRRNPVLASSQFPVAEELEHPPPQLSSFPIHSDDSYDEEDTHAAYETDCNDNESLKDKDHNVNLTNDDLAFGTNIGKDRFDAASGLPASDTIQEDFDTEAHAAEQNGLRNADVAVVRLLLYKLRHHLGAQAFDEGRIALSTSPSHVVPPLCDCRRRVAELAGFDALKFDCCFNSCICYAPDEYRELNKCPYCSENCYDANGKPRKQFSALPLIPILLALVEAERLAADMGYRAAFKKDKDGVSDVFDGKQYRRMCKKFVTVNGRPLEHKFFDGPRDIAIGLSTDGFSPLKKKKNMTAWPIVLVNYNLPPKLRFCWENIICVRCIPGPNKPKDVDSFLWFLVMELLRLAHGVKANDGTRGGQQFILRAYLILCTGDMPAVAMLMRMLGHNGILSCRMCSISGVQNPDRPQATTHYPALHRRRHPSKPEPAIYDADHLPLCTHKEFLNQARSVQLAVGPAQRKQLLQETGIKGVAVLSFLSSLSFPTSFPLGFMHLMFENIVPCLVDLWTQP